MAAKDTTIQEEILDEFQKEELELVRKSNVDLSKYADGTYDSMQMSELRLGLIDKVDVELYNNSKYDWQQMREIRKGLRDNINLISYVEKGYSTDILRQVRKARNSGVEIERYVKDGFFTYFFKTELPKVPKIKTDGSVDYQNIDFFEIVKEGQKLAEYTPSTTGYYGYTVTGKMTAPKRGKNLPQLVGKNSYFLKHIEKIDKRLAVLTEEIDVYRRRLIQYSKSIDKKKLEKTTLFQNIEFELLKRVQELDDINKQKQGYLDDYEKVRDKVQLKVMKIAN